MIHNGMKQIICLKNSALRMTTDSKQKWSLTAFTIMIENNQDTITDSKYFSKEIVKITAFNPL